MTRSRSNRHVGQDTYPESEDSIHLSPEELEACLHGRKIPGSESDALEELQSIVKLQACADTLQSTIRDFFLKFQDPKNDTDLTSFYSLEYLTLKGVSLDGSLKGTLDYYQSIQSGRMKAIERLKLVQTISSRWGAQWLEELSYLNLGSDVHSLSVAYLRSLAAITVEGVSLASASERFSAIVKKRTSIESRRQGNNKRQPFDDKLLLVDIKQYRQDVEIEYQQEQQRQQEERQKAQRKEAQRREAERNEAQRKVEQQELQLQKQRRQPEQQTPDLEPIDAANLLLGISCNVGTAKNAIAKSSRGSTGKTATVSKRADLRHSPITLRPRVSNAQALEPRTASLPDPSTPRRDEVLLCDMRGLVTDLKNIRKCMERYRREGQESNCLFAKRSLGQIVKCVDDLLDHGVHDSSNESPEL